MSKIYKHIIGLASKVDEDMYPQTSKLIADITRTGIPEDMSITDLMNYFDAADRLIPMAEAVSKLYISELKKAGEDGEDMAYNNLGAFYATGRGGKTDNKAAVKYYKKAAERGNIISYTNIGYLYMYGDGIERDYEKAFHYFLKAHFGNDDVATYKLGDMYREGLYVEKNLRTAADLYMKAYEMDVPESRIEDNKGPKAARMGDVFYEDLAGEGKNDNIALRFYQEAEANLYDQIAQGDKYHFDLLDKVINRQDEIRKNKYSVVELMKATSISTMPEKKD